MEKELSFVRLFSLAELALRRVAINLWTEADILASIANVPVIKCPVYGRRHLVRQRRYRNDEEWRETVENEVRAKVTEVVLPESLKERIMQIVAPIGLQIRAWEIIMSMHISNVRNDTYIHFLEQLCWTSVGVIDYKKTTENLVLLKTLRIGIRYKIACLYCLADSLPILWEELPEDRRRRFRDDRCDSESREERFQFYWAYVLEGEEYKEDLIHTSPYTLATSFSQYTFECSAYEGNRVRTEYFFQKMNYEEQECSLVTSAYTVLKLLDKKNSVGAYPMDNDCDVVCYLLSVMSSEEQMKVFKKHPVTVLICFLHWPWQDFFLGIADVIWTIVPENGYEFIATDICKKIKSLGYYFPNLIQKLTMNSPRNFRRIFALEFLYIFPQISNSEDTATVKVLFRTIDAEDRVKFVSGYRFSNFFKGLIWRNKWDLVETGLRALDLSKEEREKIHNKLHSCIPSIFEDEHRTESIFRLKRCLELLDDTEASAPENRLTDKLYEEGE